MMHSEKDEKSLVHQKRKLMHFVNHDIQMSEREIKVSRESNDRETRMRIERSPDARTSVDDRSGSLKNTPLVMSHLSRTLSSMST
jgi:hypothetical protein